MEFHLQKCNILSYTRLRKPVIFDYKLTNLRYLGMDIANALNWKHHIDLITKKEKQYDCFQKGNLKAMNRNTKISAYFTPVRPHLEYCSAVWSPFTIDGKKKIEAVQRRSARSVTSRYDSTCSAARRPCSKN